MTKRAYRYQPPDPGRVLKRDGIRRVKPACGQTTVRDLSRAIRAELPSAPCFRCGGRGWCEHRSAEA